MGASGSSLPVDPESAPSVKTLETVARVLEAQVDARGWDQRPSLYALVDPVTLALLAPERLPDATGEDARQDSVVLGVVPLPAVKGHPFDHLMGTYAPDYALGLLLVTEAWAFPNDVDLDTMAFTTPDMHPRRTEMRVVFAVTRWHQVACLYRVRDGQPTFEYSIGSVPGRIVGSLQRHLQQPTARTTFTTRQFFGTTWLARATSFAEAAFRNTLEVRWDPAAEALVRSDGAELALDEEVTRVCDLPAGSDVTWRQLRQVAVAGGLAGADPDAAAWMDDDFFANCIMDALPAQSDLLDTLAALLEDGSRELIRSQLLEGGWLLTRSPRQPGLS